jgi:hypothetical protein
VSKYETKQWHIIVILGVLALGFAFFFLNRESLVVRTGNPETRVWLVFSSAIFFSLYGFYGKVSWLTKLADLIISISAPRSKAILLFYGILTLSLLLLI